MFKESPCHLTGESVDNPKMVLMMEYCIETNQKATKEIAERFFNNAGTIHINYGGNFL